MAHTIYAGKVSKRKNSTLQPTLNASFDVLLKTPTSLHTPTFTISASAFDYNYLKWGDRYYFVTDVVSRNNNLWDVSAVVDVLATYKADILNTTAYVLYDSVANTEIPDNRLPIKTSKSVQVSTTPCPYVVTSGTYILSLTGSHGSTGVYKVSDTELRNLIDDVQYIYDNLWAPDPNNPKPAAPSTTNLWDWFEYLTTTCAWIFEALWSPISQGFGSGHIPENIRECKLIPFDVGVAQNHVDPVFLGTFQTRQSLWQLTANTDYKEVDVTIPWQASDYRRRSPYTEVYLYIPYFGMIKLSSENLVGQTSIHVAYGLSVRNGDMICTISSGGEILGQYRGNVAVEVPIGISNINLPKATQSIISGVANVAAKNFGGVGMSALNFGDSITPNYTCIGGLDGMAATAANQNITCYTVFHDTIAPPNQNLQVIGSPTMCSKSLATLTGYCQCVDAHVAAAAEAQELDEIDTYLNSGFYIE